MIVPAIIFIAGFELNDAAGTALLPITFLQLWLVSNILEQGM